MAQHRAALDGRLDHVRLHTGVVRRAALKDDRDVRLDSLRRHGCTAHADLLLCRTGADDIDVQLLPCQSMHRLNNGSAAQTAVKALADHQICCLRVGEGHIGNDRLADADAEFLDCFFSGNRADVHRDVLYLQRRPALLLRHEMGRLAGGEARDVVTESVAHPDLVGRDVAAHPAAERDDTERSVRTDGLHHEADLVTVRIELNDGALAAVFLAADIKVAHAVLRDLAESFGIGADRSDYVIFKAGSAVRVRDRSDHFQRRFFIHRDPPYESVTFLNSSMKSAM